MNKHSRSGPFNYHSEIWADKSGYYVYLPAALKFKFNPHNFPDSIDVNTGNGFQLDYTNNKVRTKYTSGVAILQLPFFLAADLLSIVFKTERSGFTVFYNKSINVAAVFYLMLGLVLLYYYLKSKFKQSVVLLTTTTLILGTNLYFYTIDETGMSHVYSFFLFSAFIFSLYRTKFLIRNLASEAFLIGIIGGLIVLVRPTNAIFLISFLFLDIKNKEEILIRLKRVLRLKTFIPLLISFCITILPQLLYWKYLDGSLFYYSYGDEGFNWLNPQLLHFWFAPNNGLFLYTPLYLIIILSMVYMTINRNYNTLFILLIFLGSSYMYSCWSAWNFGCSFGGRNYVEYLALFSIPLALLFQKNGHLNNLKSTLFYILILAFIIYNLKMTYSFDECFRGTRDWDWNSYTELLRSPLK